MQGTFAELRLKLKANTTFLKPRSGDRIPDVAENHGNVEITIRTESQ